MINFENLRVWQIAHEGTLLVYKLSQKLPKEELFGLISQIRRAAISIELNVAESEGRFNKQEKIQFLYMARGSCVEVRAALLIISDLYPALTEKSSHLIKTYESLESQLNSLIGYRKRSSQPSKPSQPS